MAAEYDVAARIERGRWSWVEEESCSDGARGSWSSSPKALVVYCVRRTSLGRSSRAELHWLMRMTGGSSVRPEQRQRSAENDVSRAGERMGLGQRGPRAEQVEGGGGRGRTPALNFQRKEGKF
eukprot:scaffold74925_cov29-Tisochrysis_lutea.AAC.2